MFAVIKTGGKQYRVAAADEITIMAIPGEPGDDVSFGNVLILTREGVTEIGAPYLSGVSVSGTIIEHARGPKVIAFKKRRRKNSRRKRGHRQDLTVVRITDVLVGGAGLQATTAAKASAVAGAVATGAVSEDVELIAGIGPTLSKKLRALGITTWHQVAGWTPEDVAKYDSEIGGRGRIVREEWVEQAKELLSGKPPRAKLDQERAKTTD